MGSAFSVYLDAAEGTAPLGHVPSGDGLVGPAALPVERRVGDGSHPHLLQPFRDLWARQAGIVARDYQHGVDHTTLHANPLLFTLTLASSTYGSFG